ncbi:MAG: hypothetical protein GEU74_05505 [Nitriliruptorales bacterium]|nr:hypothetical protein [Nitriliruptorales bacterium]
MTVTPSAVANALLKEFEGAWRDDTPIFACCRRSVTTVVENADINKIAAADPVARVRALRDVLEAENPGHLDTHRCCAGHLADLAFDLPDLMAPVPEG